MPPSILTWPPLADGRQHLITVGGSGISDRVVHRIITEAQPVGIRFPQNLRPVREAPAHFALSDSGFPSISAALEFWANSGGDVASSSPNGAVTTTTTTTTVDSAARSRPDIAAWTDDAGERDALLNYLSRLRETADFRNPQTRPLLANRVMRLLSAMDGHVDLRERLLAQMAVATTSCGDRVILSMNDMEIEERQTLLEGKGRGDLVKFARSMVALEEVRRRADEKIRNLPSVDEIEVRLAYEIRVGAALADESQRPADGDALELPVSTRTMLYPRCARQVTQADIDEAQAAARASANDEAKLGAFLAAWPLWHRLNRAEQAEYLKRADIAVEDTATLTAEQRDGLLGVCPISLCAPEPEELVYLHSGKSVNVFVFEALLRHWVEHGTNPMNRQPLALGQLRRPT